MERIDYLYLDTPVYKSFTEEHLPLAGSDRSLLSIFTYYDVEEEVKFTIGFPKELRDIYLREQIRNFLAEFVFKVPKQEIVYFLGENDKFYAKGVPYPVEESYLRATEVVNKRLGLRATAEYEGFLKLQKAFGEGANLAFWFSPPSFGEEGFGDYSFVFVLVKDGNLITEHIIRLEGEDSEFSKVTQALEGVLSGGVEVGAKISFPEYFSIRNETSFLSNPVIMQVGNVKEFLKRLDFAQIFNEPVEELRLLEDLIEDPLFAYFFDKYKTAVSRGDISTAKLSLIAIYNRAIEFANEKDKGVEVIQEVDPLILNEQVLVYYASQPALVSAGSCPVSGGETNLVYTPALLQWSGGRIDYFAADVLIGGEEILKCVTCPECKSVVDAKIENGEIVCPKCGARKKKH